MGKSLNQLIRQYLKQLTARDNRYRDVEEIRRLAAEGKGRPRVWQFNRGGLHGRA
jgi:hypothetical protein